MVKPHTCHSCTSVCSVVRRMCSPVSVLLDQPTTDVQSVMRNAGTAMMGTGSASGPDRAVLAAKQAVQAPLLLQSVSHATGMRGRGQQRQRWWEQRAICSLCVLIMG